MKRAFTLIEVIIALGILAVGLLGSASLLIVSVHQQRQAIDDTMGQIYARDAAALARTAGDSPTLYPPTIDAFGKRHYLPATIPAAFAPTPSVFSAAIMYRRDTSSDRVKLAVFAHRGGPSAVVIEAQDIAMVDFTPRQISPPDPIAKSTASTPTDDPGLFRKQPLLVMDSATGQTAITKFYTASGSSGTMIFDGVGGDWTSSPATDTITNYAANIYYVDVRAAAIVVEDLQ